ncbi:hypothetical protein DPEC_G00187070 [Dallia pectoralis]|uniref:Uncharacterized protein n=1 Tax=Dallia pectoralis TaxID=75939 RepID=A0ACC2GC32_DALPE|nr:hypothetical protein DPEC_G00187070 [Dallia pectoralis]
MAVCHPRQKIIQGDPEPGHSILLTEELPMVAADRQPAAFAQPFTATATTVTVIRRCTVRPTAVTPRSLCLASSRRQRCSRTADGWTPLHSACRWGQVAAASSCCTMGAELNAQTNGDSRLFT